MTPSLDTIIMTVLRITRRDDGKSYTERIAEFERLFGPITPKTKAQ